MSRLLVSLSLILFSISATARSVPSRSAAYKAANKIWISPLGFLMQMEKNNEQEMQWMQHQTFAASYSRFNLEFLLEYTRNERGTGNQTSNIELETTAWNFWIRVFNYKRADMDPWALYFGVAGGVVEQTVTTRFLEEVRRDSGGSHSQFGLKMGVEYQIPMPNPAWELQIRVEGRAHTAKDFDPNPKPSVLSNIGIATKF